MEAARRPEERRSGSPFSAFGAPRGFAAWPRGSAASGTLADGAPDTSIMVWFSDSDRHWKSDRLHSIFGASREQRGVAMGKSIAVAVALLVGRCLLMASEKEPLTASVKADYQTVRNFVVRAAEKMPADDYAFKPTPEVRSFAQQIAHIADDQYNLCAPAKGETRHAAYTAIEDSRSTKAELVLALKEAFEYCDGAYDGLTDASGAQPSLG